MYPLDHIADIKWRNLRNLMEHPEAQEADSNFLRVLEYSLYISASRDYGKIVSLLANSLSITE